MNPLPYPAASAYPAPFISAHVRANTVKILLIVGAIITGLSLLVDAISIAVPPLTEDQELGDNPAGAAVGLIILLLAVFDLYIYLTTVVFFLMWLYRAAANLRAFSRPYRVSYSPTMTVASFFIPFANLVIPYRATKEVWQKSEPPGEVPSASPASFPLWWMFWLLASLAGNISMRASFNEKISETTATIISMATSALFILAAAFAYSVVSAIDKKQEETSATLKLGRYSIPPPPPANLSASDAGPTPSPDNSLRQS